MSFAAELESYLLKSVSKRMTVNSLRSIVEQLLAQTFYENGLQ